MKPMSSSAFSFSALTQGMREVWALAAPSSAVFLIVTLVNIALIKVVADLGPDAVAAVNTGNRLYNVIQALIAGLSAGTLALVARAWGAGDQRGAAALLKTSLIVAVVMGVLLTVVMLLTVTPLVNLFNLDAQATEMSITFTSLFCLFYTSMAAYVVLASALRAAGDAITPLVCAALIGVFAVGLAIWFTYGGLGIPALGITGTAIGSGLGNLLAIGWVFWRWGQGRYVLVPTSAGGQRMQHLRDLWRTGYPAALEQLVMQGGFLAFFWVVGHYGTAAFAAYGTGVTLLSLSMVIGFGFSIAGSILVGQKLGAGDIEGARQAAWRATVQTVIVLSLFAVLLMPFADDLSLWLVQDAEVARLTTVFLYIFCFAQPFIALDMALGGALRGAGDTRFPLFSTLAGLIGMRFGVALIFLWLDLSVNWIYATILGDYWMKNWLMVNRLRGNAWLQNYSKKTESIEPLEH